MMPARDRFIALTVAAYAGLALAWIFLSDRMLSAFADVEAMRWLSTAKGLFFVLVSAGAFFVALHAVPPAATPGDERRLLDTLAAELAPGRWPRWLTVAFAVAMTLAMLIVREHIAVSFDDRPLLILFMFPIVFSALLGGLVPGLVATAVAAVGVDYLIIPPRYSFSIEAGHDLLQWFFLIANGVAVSVLSEVLRHTLAKVEISRRLLDSVISGTSDAVFVKDREGRYLLANAATGQFVGRPPAEFLGRDDRFLFPGPSAGAVMTADKAIMAAGRTQTHEEEITTGDGQTLVFLVTKGPVFDAAGRVVGVFGIAREITERKHAEDEIRRLNNRLEQRVAERTAELRAANIELEKLAFALTHNLNAPLRAIGSFAQLLAATDAGQRDAQATNYLEQILQANRSAAMLIDGILALLRCTRGELRRETIDVVALSNRLLEAQRVAEPQRRVTGEVQAGLAAAGDAAMFAMAMRQLIDNAWKFTRGNNDARIRVYAGEVDGHAGICVADNGAGFDMAHAGRLFQPFERLHRHDEFAGLGIGLAIVQRIIHRHGGEIFAVAVPGAGATFCLCLPPGQQQ